MQGAELSWACGFERTTDRLACTWGCSSAPSGLPAFPQVAKQSLRPFCTVCNRYFKTPRKFVEHVKSQGHKDKAQEVTLATPVQHEIIEQVGGLEPSGVYASCPQPA